MDYDEVIEEIRNMEIELCDDVYYTIKDYYSFSMIIGQIIAYAKCQNDVEIRKCITTLEDYVETFEYYGVFNDDIMSEFKEIIQTLKEKVEKKDFYGIMSYLLVNKCCFFEIKVMIDIEKSVIDDVLDKVSVELEYQLSEPKKQ
jgi:5'-deoxynucleotidase YfbR-like HD superfamily hydrolase